MKWIPIFNHLNCEQWIEHLMQLGLIKITKNVCHLVPPFTITINKEIHERISELYVPYEERGGLFFASIIKDNGNIILNIESVVMIENNVEQEFPYLSKGDHYFPNRILYNQTLSKNFSNENYLQILFPIHFHTHPNTNGDRTSNYDIRRINPLNMSDGDIAVSKTRHIELNEFSLFYLNSIIVGDQTGHSIIFYGDLVTPEDYTSEKANQLFEAAEEATGKIENDMLRNSSRIAIGVLSLLTIVQAPYLLELIKICTFVCVL